MVLFKRINLLLLLLLSTTFVNAQQVYKGIDDVFYYEYANNKIKVYAVPDNITTPYSGVIEIPSEARIIVDEETKTLPVVGICNDAFKDCELISISIPASVKSIGNNAFNGCTGYSVQYEDLDHMLAIDYSNGDSNPMKNAANVSVRNEILPKEIEINQDIKPYAFRGAKWLEGITLNEGVTKIGIYAFSGCEKLTSVDIEAPISFGEGTFNGCHSLKEILIPSSVTQFGKAMFKQSGLENITIETTAPLSEEMFLGCEKLKNVILHQNTTTIGKGAFAYCYSLESLPLPQGGSGLNIIGEEAFKKCTGFKSIEIPVSVVSIGKSAFSECTNLTDLIIPTGSQLSSIEINAFSSNSSLKTVYSHAMTAPNASAAAFDADRIDQIQLFYDEGASGYDNEPWSLFLTPQTFPTRTITYYADDIVISGEIPVEVGQEPPLIEDPQKEGWTFAGWREEIPKLMPNENLEIHGYFTREYSYNQIQYLLCSDRKEASVIGYNSPVNIDILSSISYDNNEYKIVSINARAFENSESLKSVNLSGATNLINFGNAIFADCKNLENVILPESLTEITDSMFWGCSALSTLEIPTSVNTIGDFAFRKCGIYEVSLPKSITTMGKNVFSECGNLKTVLFDKDMNLPILPDHTFYGCQKLETITLPSTTTTIGNTAFYNCRCLKILVLDNIENIDSIAFKGCDALEVITLPASMNRLDDHVFVGCPKIKMITVNSSEPPILGADPFNSVIYDNAVLYVSDTDIYNSDNKWKKFKKIEKIKESPMLIYLLDGKEYAKVQQNTGTKVDPKGEPDENHNPKGRVFSGWIGEPKIMPNKDSVIVGTLKYQRTYIAKGTEDVLYTDSLFYEKAVSDPNELKKEGLDYIVIEPFSTMPAKDDTLYVRYTLKSQYLPKGKENIIYNGTPQTLLKEKGSTQTGTLKYSLDKANFSIENPVGTDAKTYKVYYRVEGITAHYSTEPDSLEVTISPKQVSNPIITLSQSSYTYDGGEKKPEVKSVKTTINNKSVTIPLTEYSVSYQDNITI